MADKTYALLAAATNIVFDVQSFPAEAPIASVVGPQVVAVDVTGFEPRPTAGQVGTLNGTAWTFGAGPAAQAALVPPAGAALVTMFQFKAALAGATGSGGSLLDNVAAWVATQPETIQVAWTNADAIARGGAFITAAGAHFNWSDTQLTSFFAHAFALPLTA